MFRMTSNHKFEGEVQTLRFTRDPFYYGLGIYKDTDGVKWDVRGCIGIGRPAYIQAARMDGMHPYFNDTSDAHFGFVQQQWIPYYVLIVDEEGNVVKDYREEKDERKGRPSASNVPVGPTTD